MASTNFNLLSRLSQAIASTQDTTELLRTIIRELQPVFGFYDVGLFVVNQAEDYHVDLATEMPEISPSEANLANHLRSEKMPYQDSSIAWAIDRIEAAGQPVLFDFVDLVDHFPDYPQWEVVQQTGYRDCLATTLQVRGEAIGMFCLNSLEKDHFRPAQFDLFQAVADQVAITLSHIQAKEAVLAQKQRVEQLLTISETITEISDRQQLLKTIYQRIKPIFPYDGYGLFVLTEDGQQHYELIDAEIMDNDPSQVAIEQQYGAHHRYDHSNSPVDEMMRQGPALFSMKNFLDAPQGPALYEAGIRQLIAGPLTYGGEPIGMLCFNSHQEDGYREADLPLFEAIAEQMSVAVANVLANERVLHEKDQLQKLYTLSEVMATVQHRHQLKAAFDRIREIFPFDNAGLFVVEEGEHYELLDRDTLSGEATQSRIEAQFGRYARYAHPHSPVAHMMQAGGAGCYPVAELLNRYPAYPQNEAIRTSGLQQVIAAPLRRNGQLMGLLNFNSKRADQYGEADLAMVQSMAEQMSTVVSNILSNEREQQERQFKETLLGISEAVASIQDRKELFRVIFERIRPVIPFYDIGLIVIDEESKWAEDLAVTHSDIVPSEGTRLMNSDLNVNKKISYPGSAIEWYINKLEKGRPKILSYSELFSQFPSYHQNEVLQKLGYQEGLYTLLKVGSKTIGAVNINSLEKGSFQPKQFPLFQAIADQLAVAVSNVLSNEALQQRAEEKVLELALIKGLEGSAPLPDKLPALASLLHAALLCLWVETPVHSYGYHLLPTGPQDFQRLDKEQYLSLLQLSEEAYRQGYPSHPSKAFLWTAGQPSAPHPLLTKIMRRWQMQSALVLPLSLSDEQSAYLTLAARPEDYYTEQQLAQLSKLGDTLSLALDRQLGQQQIAQLNEQLQQENEYLLEEVSRKYSFGEMIGQSDSLQRVFTQIEQVAYTDASVLVQGETGTGKELIARAIHQASPQQDHLLVKINCAAIPEALFESELFGHEKGAFTGAVAQRKGKFELAHRGTIFLDEVGELPLSMQAKLLRVLQEGEFERVGGNQVIKSNFRVVAATNRELRQSIEAGKFRADLYYRLSTFPIELLPLRERREDIPLLAEHFARQYSRHIGVNYRGFTKAALRTLPHYEFPGNIRELRNMIEHAVIVSKGKRIDELSSQSTSSLKAERKNNSATVTSHANDLSWEEHERAIILSTLARCGGRIQGAGGAAEILKLNPSTLASKMRKLGIKRQPMFR